MSLLRKGFRVYTDQGLLGLLRRGVSFIRENPHYSHYMITNMIFRIKYGLGTDIMTEDWDNLILLDACRYDAFTKQNILDGTLRRQISKGSASLEFIEENFANRELHDTVYVTANTYYTALDENVFHAVISCLDEWDNDLQTVHPQSVVKKAIEAHIEYPNKRLIIHFMQPHAPYIGEYGQQLQDKIQETIEVRGMNLERGIRGWEGKNMNQSNQTNAIQAIQAPNHDELNITDEDVTKAYLENLDIALLEVEKLITKLTGKTIISADHGELIGERVFPLIRKRYEHPNYLHTKHLCVVPWFIIDSDNRREIIPEPPERFDKTSEDEVESQLKALGYI